MRCILSRIGCRIMSVAISTGIERPLRMTRTTVRSGVVAMTTPLSPANGPKVIVTTAPLVISLFRRTQLTAADYERKIGRETLGILGFSSKGTVTGSEFRNRNPV